MPSLDDLRSAVRKSPPEGDVRLHGSEKNRAAHALEEAYQTETGGKVLELQTQIGIWRERQGFETHWRNVPEKLMLTVTELSEAMEAFRHLKPEFLERLDDAVSEPIEVKDDFTAEQIVWFENFAEELADTMIRLFDLADAMGINLQREVCAKMAINELRPYKHGKEC